MHHELALPSSALVVVVGHHDKATRITLYRRSVRFPLMGIVEHA